MESLSLGPRTLWNLIRDPFRIFGRNAVPLLVIGAVPWALVSLVADGLGWSLPAPDAGSTLLAELLDPALAYLLVGGFLTGVLVYPLVNGALLHALGQRLLGQSMAIGRAYGVAWARKGALIGVFLWIGLVCLILVLGAGGLGYGLWQAINSDAVRVLGLGVLLLGTFGLVVYLVVRWAFVVPAIMVEGLGPRAALARSAALVRPFKGRVLTAVVGWQLVVVLLTAGLEFIPFLPSLAAEVVPGPLAELGPALLYFDLRVRQEGYGVDDLTAELNHEDHIWKGA